jgi:hypothetical protein
MPRLGEHGVLVDDTTLVLVATIVQTVVITLTLLVFIFQFRSQEKALKENSYQNLLGRYSEFMMSEAASDESLISRFLASTGKLDPSDVASIKRLALSYGLIEEAYELYKRKWIDDDQWSQWDTWLKAISNNQHFATFHSRSTGMYDKDFQAHVTRMLESKKPA